MVKMFLCLVHMRRTHSVVINGSSQMEIYRAEGRRQRKLPTKYADRCSSTRLHA